jgi:hypothetical protein
MLASAAALLAAAAATQDPGAAFTMTWGDAPSVPDFAVFSCRAYRDCPGELDTPNGWSALIGSDGLRNEAAFQGMSWANDQRKQLMVSFAGTKPSDKPDLIADEALGKIALLEGRALEFAKTQREMLHRKWKLDPSSDRYAYQVLALKLKLAQKFYDDAVGVATRRFGQAPTAVFVTGHSLGGWLAAVVGVQKHSRAHTFNPAPGARIFLGMRARQATPLVMNHRRKRDIVSALDETHAGKLCTWPSDKINPLGVHSIAGFVSDLRKGIKGVVCR